MVQNKIYYVYMSSCVDDLGEQIRVGDFLTRKHDNLKLPWSTDDE